MNFLLFIVVVGIYSTINSIFERALYKKLDEEDKRDRLHTDMNII